MKSACRCWYKFALAMLRVVLFYCILYLHYIVHRPVAMRVRIYTTCVVRPVRPICVVVVVVY